MLFFLQREARKSQAACTHCPTSINWRYGGWDNPAATGPILGRAPSAQWGQTCPCSHGPEVQVSFRATTWLCCQLWQPLHFTYVLSATSDLPGPDTVPGAPPLGQYSSTHPSSWDWGSLCTCPSARLPPRASCNSRPLPTLPKFGPPCDRPEPIPCNIPCCTISNSQRRPAPAPARSLSSDWVGPSLPFPDHATAHSWTHLGCVGLMAPGGRSPPFFPSINLA